MFLSMNWIRDFVDLEGIDLDALIHQFTLSTAEVEGSEHVGEDISGVVVGQILSVEAHPNSGKLHLLKVDAGERVYDVVCGAPNVAVGMKVPFAKTGGRVGELEIAKRPVAGVDSEGMCCSEKELGLSDNHEGLMVLPEDAPVGTDIKKLYEIEDVIFEVDNKSLTNRPDLWGHYGIAREIAALTGRALKPLAKADLAGYANLPAVPVEVKNNELLYRYSALAVKNITVAKSPVNMRIRLYRCGMRAINLLADLTNYIMMELGQPMHAFDYKRVSRIEVGCYDKPFVFQTLDGKERTIEPTTLMIQSAGEPVAVAGIMGGLASEIVDDTDSFLLESANFDAVSVRKSAAAIGLRTDASMRYEKTLDPEMTVDAIGRYLYLLKDIDGGVEVISSLTDCYVKHYPVHEIDIDKAYVDRVTGIEIKWEDAIRTLKSLGFCCEVNGENCHLTVPSWRATKDVTMKADIIEEITRIYGYDNFEIKTAECAVRPVAYSPMHELTRGVKDLLAFTFGAHEVQSYIWNDGKRLDELGLPNEGFLTLTNAISPDISTIRAEIIPTLLCMALKNRGYAPEYSVFEIGSVVRGLKADGLADEHKVLGLLLCGRKNDEERLFFKAREIVETMAKTLRNTEFGFVRKENPRVWQHPYNAFEIKAGDTVLGELAVVHPTVAGKVEKKSTQIAVELDMEAFCAAPFEPFRFAEPSKYPEIVNDITFIVPKELPYSAFEERVAAVACPVLTKFGLVGIYRDPNAADTKSVTLRFTFVSEERTLSGEEVAGYAEALMASMAEIGAVVNK